MAMMVQWCGAAARRVLMAEQRALFTTSSSSSAAVAAAIAKENVLGAPMLCGRGDKKTKKGKRFKGSFGNARPKKEKMIERIKDKVEVPSASSAIMQSPMIE